jgi:CPA2 family monovalent cation:H+ antiporter-2
MSLAQIGEFSFVTVGLGVALGAAPPFLYAVAVGVSVLTALSTPWLIRASPAAAAWVDRKLPARLQTFAALYGSWVERLGAAPRGVGVRARLRRLFGLLALDALTLGALSVAASAFATGVAGWLAERFGAETSAALALLLAAAGTLAAPLVFGVARIARRIATALAEQALPHTGGAGLDLSAAPRRLLVTTLQLALVLLVSLPLLAATQPFLPRGLGPLVLGLGTALLAIGLWRSAADLQGHVRAGATAIIEALARPGPRDRATDSERALAAVRELLPGLGEPHTHRIGAESHAAGRTLSELNLRGLTGATLLAITRGERSVTLPSAGERLETGDVLALAGSHEAVAAAIALLERGDAAGGGGGPL